MLAMPPSPSVKQRDETLRLSYQLKRCKENTISFLLFLLLLYPKRTPFLAIIQTHIPPNSRNISEVGKGVYETSALRKDVVRSGNYFLHWKCLFSLNGIHRSHKTKQGERAKLSDSKASFAYRVFFHLFYSELNLIHFLLFAVE